MKNQVIYKPTRRLEEINELLTDAYKLQDYIPGATIPFHELKVPWKNLPEILEELETKAITDAMTPNMRSDLISKWVINKEELEKIVGHAIGQAPGSPSTAYYIEKLVEWGLFSVIDPFKEVLDNFEAAVKLLKLKILNEENDLPVYKHEHFIRKIRNDILTENSLKLVKLGPKNGLVWALKVIPIMLDVYTDTNSEY